MVTIREAGQLATTAEKAIRCDTVGGDAASSVGREEVVPFLRDGERPAGRGQLSSTVGVWHRCDGECPSRRPGSVRCLEVWRRCGGGCQ